MSLIRQLPLFAAACLLAFSSSLANAKSALWEAHQSDTVNWHPWDPALLEKAKDENKPLFFFVAHFGNSLAKAMLNETFQNKTIAATLNDTAIPILVETNEEPELASFLQDLAYQHFDGNELPTCLWTDTSFAPLNGGGYFPPTDDWGGQGFLSLARNVSDQWQNNPDEYRSIAADRLKRSSQTRSMPSPELLPTPARFPTTPFLSTESPTLPALDLFNYTRILPLLPEQHAEEILSALEANLSQITSGAGFDSVSGGFFSGSNDANWKLPLFQKSTTDQALLLLAVSNLSQKAPKPIYRDLIRLTLEHIDSDLTKPDGLARQYLDSFAQGESPDTTEGSYYLVSSDEVSTLSPKTTELWGLSPNGNLDQETDILGLYTKQNIPFANSESIYSKKEDELRLELRKLRETKPRPLSDDTGYTATNALIIKALVAIAKDTEHSNRLAQAQERFNTLLTSTFNSSGKTLYNSNSRTQTASTLDYTYIASVALDLYDVTKDIKYLDTAKTIYNTWQSDDRFQKANPLLLSSGIDSIWFSNYLDSTIPSAASVHIENLKRLNKAPEPQLKQIFDTLPNSVKSTPERYRSLFAAHGLAISEN
ncbi:DUF255 domain-containing protein [Pelagicoccus mobilis]|uniref:Thioredoxin domain-containing protein n=1 Tax=Pelagicoccus mobilis TaxID=415221 RepID=A0A934VSV4_9BACT|nr:DUF255 domain-containing protein [Pelagicoccus mobilis]MBK1879053.1 thioredoxin domain-containing protein [Pelagicoccus mobilis]